jgi:hypothetical protein
MRHLLRAASTVAAMAIVTSCSPTAPGHTSEPSPTGLSLFGKVVDNAGRLLPGARVEVVTGQGMGTSVVTNEVGRYQLPSTLGGTISVRASKEGYESSAYTFDLPRSSPTDFVLHFLGPSLDVAGNYTVTFTAAATCTELPQEARVRTYQASITRTQGPNRYGAEVSGGQFYSQYFTASVSGSFASFQTDAVGNHIHERLTPTTSLSIDFYAGNAPIDLPTFSVPMFARLAYCADDNPADAFYCRVPRMECSASNNTFTLARH